MLDISVRWSMNYRKTFSIIVFFFVFCIYTQYLHGTTGLKALYDTSDCTSTVQLSNY